MRDRTPQEPFDEEIVGGPVSEAPTIYDLRSLLSVLSPREEEVLPLRLESLKYREIAEQLGISVNSVNTLLARALRKLQKAIARETSRWGIKSNEKMHANRASLKTKRFSLIWMENCPQREHV